MCLRFRLFKEFQLRLGWEHTCMCFGMRERELLVWTSLLLFFHLFPSSVFIQLTSMTLPSGKSRLHVRVCERVMSGRRWRNVSSHSLCVTFYTCFAVPFDNTCQYETADVQQQPQHHTTYIWYTLWPKVCGHTFLHILCTLCLDLFGLVPIKGNVFAKAYNDNLDVRLLYSHKVLYIGKEKCAVFNMTVPPQTDRESKKK